MNISFKNGFKFITIHEICFTGIWKTIFNVSLNLARVVQKFEHMIELAGQMIDVN